MSPPAFRREYLVQLPLPLAQLYSRAYNAKDARSRHDNAFYLFEALIKLAAAPLIFSYLEECERGGPRVEKLDRLLERLALPSLGQWLQMLRELARFFGERPDASSHRLGRLWRQLSVRRRDLPAALALYRRVKHGPDGEPADDSACSLLDLFESLVQYRNAVFGHGAARFDSFYAEEMGPLLFPAVNEVLAEGTLDVLGPPGSRLVYLTELRTVDDDCVEVGLRDVVGLQSERLAPLTLARDEAAALLPNRLGLLWPGRKTPLRLDPLLIYRESETAEEVLFLNRDRNGRQIEYLSYTTGRTERDRATSPELAALLTRIADRPVADDEVATYADRSRAGSPPADAPTPLDAPEGRIVGDYEFLAELGKGGMGVVYLARQLSLGRLVAVKMLHSESTADEAALARFRREIRHLARCEHPHIVKVLASGTLPDGRLYYAMEYVPGCDLEQVWREVAGRETDASIADRPGSDWDSAVTAASRKTQERTRDETASTGTGTSAPPVGEVAAAPPQASPASNLPQMTEPADRGSYVRRVALMIRDASSALASMHEHHVIHRDVKPANLMLTADGSRVVLMDFGLAKGESLALTASRSTGLLGTLRYAAPEQLASATLKVGPAADVRALGVVFWELLTRRRIFADAQDELQLAQKVHEEDVPRLRSIDPGFDRDLEAIVTRATERRVADRIASAADLARYLDLYLENRPLPIRPPSAGELVGRWAAEHRPQVIVASVAFAAVLLTVVTAFVLIAQALQDSQRSLAQSYLQRGVVRLQAGQTSEGLWDLWRVYEAVDPDDPLRRSTRHLMGGWARRPAQPVEHPWSDLVVAVSAAGDTAFVGSADGTGALLDVATAKQIGGELSHGQWIRSAAFSSDGELLATGCDDGSVRLWHARTGNPVWTSAGESGSVRCLAFCPRGRRIVAGSVDGVVRLWDAKSGRLLRQSREHYGEVLCIAFHPDGDSFLTASKDYQAIHWDSESGEELHSVDDHLGWVTCVVFDDPGETYFTGTATGMLRRWNAKSGEAESPPLPHAGALRTLVLSPDGERLLAGCDDGSVHCWSLDELTPRFGSLRHFSPVNVLRFSPDGRRVLVGCENGAAQVWDVSTGLPDGSPVHTGSSVLDAAFAEETERLAVGAADGSVRVLKWSDGLLSLESAIRLGEAAVDGGDRAMAHEFGVWSVAYSPDGETIATGSGSPDQNADSHGVRMWRVEDAAPLRGPEGIENPPRSAVRSVAFSADGSRFLTAGDDGTVRIWDAAGRVVETSITDTRFDGTTLSVWSAEFSPNGQELAIAFIRVTEDSQQGVVEFWDMESNRWSGTPLTHPQGDVWDVDFSPDGRRIVTACEDGYARAWDVSTRETLVAIPHPEGVWSVEFDAEGREVLTGCGDGAARIWNADTGRPAGEPMRHGSGIWSAVYNHGDGDATLVTCDANRTAQVWDVGTQLPIGAPLRHEHVVTTARFSPDGRSLLTGCADGSARIWTLADALPDDPRTVRGWLEAETGGTLDREGRYRALPYDAWMERREESRARLSR